ncbi:5-formyltetrahydrofolate cyclo-ligase [Glacieibacterium frigidum]|uniref:5-formyltetrahydrofolate cyclo-ligase n=1 Tax=Glacieibacterium frigidum TaxID=2593303 RepID=A0A552UHL3_9SPHN|nr:5-formyltetrahydrofolate cyclo-ligase [Glacieibacterium frigidum]TRW17677.1 5-formyltetrahydrofolate cyclo-ligase [Glacieibacterium frigidum]
MAVPPTSPRDALRAAARAARAAFVAGLTPEQRTAHDAALVARLMPLLDGCTHVAGFAAFGDEVDPAGAGFEIWPRVGLPGEPLSFHRAAAEDLEVSTVWGIREPRIDAPIAVPDAVIVPLVAADARGNRLGYGKGHYDRTLSRLDAPRIGVAWDCQIVDAVPAERWDERLDWLVTPTRTIRCDGAAVGGARGEG